MGVSRATVERWEAGITIPQGKQLKRLKELAERVTGILSDTRDRTSPPHFKF